MDQAQLTSSTSTYQPPTLSECEKKIRLAMCTYVTKKWWQSKKYLIEDAIKYAKQYNNHFN